MVNGQTTIPLCKEIDAALKKCNTSTNIADNITENYKALASVFASLEKPFIESNDVVQYNSFKASYHKLAANAYNKSLGNYHGLDSFQTNAEINEDLPSYSATFIEERELAGLRKGELTDDKAQKIMNTTLTTVGGQLKVSSEVLKKVIELALYNESLYGLNDFAATCNVNKNVSHEMRTFSPGKPTTYGGGLAKLDSSGNVKKRKRTYNPVCEPVKASHRRKICPNTKV